MRRLQRLMTSVVLISLCGVLAGCGGGMSSWDPSDMLGFLDTKKKMPGNRRPVFPDGVPGIEQGVPKDLYKSEVDQQQQQDRAAAPVAAAPPPEEPKQARRSRAKAESANAGPAAAGVEGAPADGGSVAPAAPKSKRLVHRRATSLPKEQPAQQEQPTQQQQPSQQSEPAAASPFPAPLPSGGFSR